MKTKQRYFVFSFPAVAASNGNATDTEAQIDQTENVVCYETFFQQILYFNEDSYVLENILSHEEIAGMDLFEVIDGDLYQL